MRVLILHSRYASGATSGENRVVDDEAALLREGGHEVRVWSPEPDDSSPAARAGMAARAVWSRAAAAEVARLVRAHAPDVVHVHNLYPMLSPAVLRIQDPPVVVTLHNYRLLCLPAVFLRDGRPCEDCLGRPPWRGVVHRCYRGSAAGSAALAASLVLHRRTGSFRLVARYLAVSEFVREKHVEAGLDPGRITVKPNFVAAMPRREGPGSEFLYLGRLSAEKGLDRLMEAWNGLPARLVVVGDGPERERLAALAPANVELRGAVAPADVPAHLARARALVLPSICYEGAPRTVVEAFAAGVPVIANRLGALPSVVADGETGMLVEPGSAAAWRDAVTRLLDDRLSRNMGDRAHADWQSRYSPEQGLADLEEAYGQVTGSALAGRTTQLRGTGLERTGGRRG